MGKVRVAAFGVSLDGFGAGLSQSLEHPLGVGFEKVMDWFFPTRVFRAMQGQDGGLSMEGRLSSRKIRIGAT